METSRRNVGISTRTILVNEQGNILTIRRSSTAPTRPLHWDLPGGELDFGEEVKDGAIREVKEETGINVTDLSIVDVLSSVNDKEEHWVTVCYSARIEAVKVILSYEHDDYKWVTPNEFLEMMASPKNKKFVERFILFYERARG